MPASSKSSVRETPRPVNVFYVWYSEVCRRLNTTPLSIVKPAKPKNSTVLDFVCDRIKPEEWTPVLNALGKDTSLHVIAIRSRAPCKFMPEIDTEDKVRSMKRRYGCLYTAYILRALIKSICSVLKKSQVLASLELDGLPVTVQYIETLLIHLRKNNTLRVLSLQHCPLRDIGCQQLCLALRFMPNIEVLNLSGCDLTSISGEYIAKLIKYQQINRYCESWHNSLRYEEPEVGNMRGLKRITLNNNPNIGDDGLVFIIDELDDDLWIKALDMQKCGITEKLSGRLLDLVDYSRSLEIADFRHNEGLSDATVEKILEILSRKQNLENTEFHWCLTASSLCYDQCRGMTSAKSCNSTSVQQSKSAPFQPILPSCSKPSLRRTKTAISMNKRPFEKSYNNISISQAKKECVALNDKLKREIAKRQEMEKANEELHQKLDTITSLATLNATKEQNPEKSTEADEIKNEALLPPKPMPQVIIKAKNGFVRKKEKEGKDAEHAKSISKAPNGLNGFKHPPGKAQDIFEGLLYKDGMCEEGDDVDIQEFYELACNLKSKSKVALYLDTTNEQTLDELSVSSISLQKLIEEMEEEDDGNLEANLDSAGRTSTTKRTVSKPSTWKCKSTNGIIVR